MELVTPDIGQPFYRAITSIDALALTESPPAGAEGGSNSLQRWGRRVRKARNSLSPSGDSVAVSGRVVAESIVCVCPLVAVRGECEVQSLSRPVLVGMLVKRHDEATAVGVAELDGDTDRRQAALEQQRRARMA